MKRLLPTILLLASTASAGGPLTQADPAFLANGATTLFDLDYSRAASMAGWTALSESVTVNSTTIAPSCSYRGVDAGASSWASVGGAGPTLALTGSGTAPTTGINDPFTIPVGSSTDAAAQFFSGKYYQHASDTTSCNLGTDDIMIEYMVRLAFGATSMSISKRNSGAAGWDIESFNLDLFDGTTQVLVAPGIGTADTWIFVDCFVDRSEASTNGAICYGDGLAGTAMNASALGTLSNSLKFSLGAAPNGGFATSEFVAGVRVYHSPGWFAGGATNPAQWLALHLARWQALTAATAATGAGSTAPTRQVRGSVAYMDNAGATTRPLLSLDSNWVGPSRRQALSGATSVGVLIQPPHTNLLLQSQVAGTTWTEPTAGDAITSNTQMDPGGLVTGDDFDAALDATGIEHCNRQTATLTATTYTLSRFLKAGQQTHAYLRDGTIANGVAWFDLSACAACTTTSDCPAAVGTVQAGIAQAKAFNYGGGWCRVTASFTGTAASHTLDTCGASADNVLTYTEAADSVADWSMWQADLIAYSAALTPVRTTTTTSASAMDDLRYSSTSNVSATSGTLIVDVLVPNTNTPAAPLLSVGDATGMFIALDSSGHATWTGTSAWAITGTTDISDGVPHTIRCTYAQDSFHLYVDGVEEGTPDTSGSVPAFGSTMYIGETNTLATQFGGLILRVRALDRPVAPSVGNP